MLASEGSLTVVAAGGTSGGDIVRKGEKRKAASSLSDNEEGDVSLKYHLPSAPDRDDSVAENAASTVPHGTSPAPEDTDALPMIPGTLPTNLRAELAATSLVTTPAKQRQVTTQHSAAANRSESLPVDEVEGPTMFGFGKRWNQAVNMIKNITGSSASILALQINVSSTFTHRQSSRMTQLRRSACNHWE